MQINKIIMYLWIRNAPGLSKRCLSAAYAGDEVICWWWSDEFAENQLQHRISDFAFSRSHWHCILHTRCRSSESEHSSIDNKLRKLRNDEFNSMLSSQQFANGFRLVFIRFRRIPNRHSQFTWSRANACLLEECVYRDSRTKTSNGFNGYCFPLTAFEQFVIYVRRARITWQCSRLRQRNHTKSHNTLDKKKYELMCSLLGASIVTHVVYEELQLERTVEMGEKKNQINSSSLWVIRA